MEGIKVIKPKNGLLKMHRTLNYNTTNKNISPKVECNYNLKNNVLQIGLLLSNLTKLAD
jgi:hypothetical protein